MLSISSVSPFPSPAPHLTLSTLWKVEADESYHGKYWDAHPKNNIAIRTVDGAGEVEVNGVPHLLTKGSLLIFRYGDMRYYEPQNGFWNFYWFEFEGARGALPFDVTVNAELTEEDVETMEECFRSLPFPSESAYISGVFTMSLLKWLHGYRRESNGEERLISAAVDRILTTPDVTVTQLAELAHMGERSFRTLFKKHIGVSPQEYVSETRIKNAEELLLTTSMSIKEISYALGFQNQYYFSAFFKKKKGVYPREFRKRV